MRKRKILIIFGIFAFLVLLDLPFAVAAQLQPNKAPTIVTEEIGWQLTKASVINTGTTVETKEGIFTSGYELDATASAIGSAPLLNGKFRMIISIFSPNADMPGQRAGKWYVQGEWTITDPKSGVPKSKHSSDTVRGSLMTELSFNPATGKGIVDAIVNLPMSLTAGKWASAKGTFSGNEKFEGIISLTLDIWPDVREVAGR